MVVGLEVALADGRVVHTGGQAPRAACGPDLNQLFVGSEGTLGVITEARLRAAPAPTAESRSAYGFASFAEGLDACRRMLRRGARPAVLRLYDAAESSRSFGRSDGCVLLVADEGDACIIASTMRVVEEEAATVRRLESQLVDQWMEGRSDTSALEMAVRLGLTVDTIEVAARWSALAAVHREAIDALQHIDGTVVASAHQSHAYADGACLYFTFAGHPAADGASGSIVNAADSYYRRAWDAVVSVVTAHGGALSHHHGVGLNRGRYLAGALGPAFDVLGAVKAALDPAGVLNPGQARSALSFRRGAVAVGRGLRPGTSSTIGPSFAAPRAYLIIAVPCGVLAEVVHSGGWLAVVGDPAARRPPSSVVPSPPRPATGLR